MLDTARPGIPSPAESLSFVGNGFSVAIPAAWVDRTIYTYVGPAGRDPAAWVRILVDPAVMQGTVGEFADVGIRAASAAAPGYRLLRRQDVKLTDGSLGIRAEVRWFPTDDLRLYQRMLYVLWGKTGITITSHLTKKTRLTQGPVIDGLMESIRRRGGALPVGQPSSSGSRPPAPGNLPPTPASPFPASGSRVVADRFTMDLPDGWKDETVYMLAEPDESRFRRNLVIRREKLETAPGSLGDLARAEVDNLAASVPGFELMQEAQAAVRDGGPAHRLVFRRSLESGAKVLQLQHVAWRVGFLYWLSLTVEDAIEDREKAVLLAVLESFSGTAAQQGVTGP